MKPIVSARITIGGFRFALPTPRATHLTRPVNANASLCLNNKPQPQESRLDACWNACPLSHSCGRHDLKIGRASCRERVWISVGAGAIQRKRETAEEERVVEQR